MLFRAKTRKISVLKFTILDDINFIEHAVSTRLGGVSKFPFDSLNISLDVGDNPFFVKKNRLILQEALGGNFTVYLKQLHRTRILVLNKKNLIAVKNILNGEIYYADAAITDLPGVNIAIQSADCQAVSIIDAKKKVIANIHVGWRGSVNSIIRKTINSMVRVFDCNPVDMIASVSPSLGPCCAEFLNYRKEFPKAFYKYKEKNSSFNFWKISKDQLCEAGLSKKAIHSCSICTKCNADLFFSYRKNKITGRFANILRICGSLMHDLT